MDQKFKQRLIGAIVITAVAAIFVPMMFDDPIEKSGKTISDLEIPKFPEEEFKSHNRQLPTSIDQVAGLPKKGSGENIQVEKQSASTENKPSELVRWVIQVGSFGEEKNAVIFRDKLRKQGFSAFVEKNESFFRVRVGPELDKARAEKIKKSLEKKNKDIKSILVSE